MRFKTYIEEVYRPVDKDEIEWQNRGEEGYYHEKHMSDGTHVSCMVEPVHTGRHDFSFAVNGFHTSGTSYTPSNPKTHREIYHYVSKAFNHYAQHMLPKGHHLYASASDQNPERMAKKQTLYNRAAGKIATNGGYNFSTTNLDAILTKVAESREERRDFNHMVHRLNPTVRKLTDFIHKPARAAMLAKEVSDDQKVKHPSRRAAGQKVLRKLKSGKGTLFGRKKY